MLAPGVCMSITEARYINDGKGTLVNPEKFNKQDYQQLKQDFFKHRYRYIDDTFPPDNTSIGKVIDGVVWKRPRELVKNPNFIVSDISRFDFGQGNVGNCWFLASIGALTYQKDILNQVIDSEQNFEYGYCGIFHFRFWRFGKWVDVVIDDKLPTLQGKLIFVQSRTSNEFWPALLEKAYAKVCGSYADMDAGTLSEAMMDFTGGIHITYSLEKAPPNIWHVLLRAAKSQSMIGCTTPHGEIPGENKVAPNGLVCGHAYTVTGVTQVMSRDMPVNLVRVFNPWGFGEWEGDWSDRSSLWETVYPEERQKYLSVAIDGEFWMTVEDFCKNFNEVTICCLNLNFLDENITSVWTASFHNGRWLADITAGGHETFEKTFWMNPQYRVKIDELENDCSEYNILVSLMQKSKSGRRRFEKNLFIGFSVYEVSALLWKRGKFPASFFNTSRLVKKTTFHVDSREVMEKFRLKPGEYLIVPSTAEPKQSRSFILSILTKAKINFEEVDAEQLQRILNENLLKVTGKLNSAEFKHLWDKVTMYRDIFFHADVDHSGNLSLSELRNAMIASGLRMGDDMLCLMALRYGGSSGNISVESFISLVLRMNTMARKNFLSNTLQMLPLSFQWMQISMYT
uniref:Calpain catalytic domain-containing protein n=1 Tax=Esox lucius TaxID=8010 RepID=A0A3P8YMN5_ESOLU